MSFVAEKDKRYLIRVGERFGSESGDFRLELFVPEPGGAPARAAHSHAAVALRRSIRAH